MVNSEIVIVPAIFGVSGFVVALRMLLQHKEKMAGLRSDSRNSLELESRLERIEQAVDSIAVEMERVGEGQRFVTKLLAERPAGLSEGLSAQRGRVITPH